MPFPEEHFVRLQEQGIKFLNPANGKEEDENISFDDSHSASLPKQGIDIGGPLSLGSGREDKEKEVSFRDSRHASLQEQKFINNHPSPGKSNEDRDETLSFGESPDPDKKEDAQGLTQCHISAQKTAGIHRLQQEQQPELRVLFQQPDDHDVCIKVTSVQTSELRLDNQSMEFGHRDRVVGATHSLLGARCVLEARRIKVTMFFVPWKHDMVLYNETNRTLSLESVPKGFDVRSLPPKQYELIYPGFWRLYDNETSVEFLFRTCRYHLFQTEDVSKRTASGVLPPPKRGMLSTGAATARATKAPADRGQKTMVQRSLVNVDLLNNIGLAKNQTLTVVNGVTGQMEYSVTLIRRYKMTFTQRDVFKATWGREGSKPMTVAVKFHKITSAQPYAAAAAIKGWERELKAHKDLDHPCIAKLISFDSRLLALIIEHQDLQDLSAPYWCSRDGPDARKFRGAIDDACRIAADVSSALAYLDGRGIVHNDIRPANIIYGGASAESGARAGALLIDFGLSRVMKDQNEDLGGGSPWYLAPEFMNGRRDPPADVYSLGVVMLYLLRAICLPETQKHWNLEATLQKAPDAVEDSRILHSTEAEDDSGSEADDSESLESSAVHRRQLLDSIKNLEEAGSFAASRTHHSFPNPGIRVDGEIIALPLSDEAARNLASRSLNAPVGFAGTDEAVSKTLEIGVGRIAFMNPIWSDFIEDVVSHVAQELGVPSPADGHQVRAKFSRHLLHPPGATLEAPKYAEEIPARLGVLYLICPYQLGVVPLHFLITGSLADAGVITGVKGVWTSREFARPATLCAADDTHSWRVHGLHAMHVRCTHPTKSAQDWFLRLAAELEERRNDIVQGRLLAKAYLFLRDFMPRGLTDVHAHILGDELMRYLLCHANEHARARHRLYQDALSSFQELREWMGAASSWETALQNATQSAGGRENAAAPGLHSPERLLAVLVINYPEIKLKKLVAALQVQWMMAPQWALDNMPEFLPQWAQHLILSGEPDLSDLREAGGYKGNDKEDYKGDRNEGHDAKALPSPDTPLSSVFSERPPSQSRRNTGSPELQSRQPIVSAHTPCHPASTNAAAGLSGRASQGLHDPAAAGLKRLGLFAGRAKRPCSAAPDAPNKAPRLGDLTREDFREELRADHDILQAKLLKKMKASLEAEGKRLRGEIINEVAELNEVMQTSMDKLEADVKDVKIMVKDMVDRAVANDPQLGGDGFLDKHCLAPQGIDQELYSLRLLRAGWFSFNQLGCPDDGAGADRQDLDHQEAAQATTAKFSDVPEAHLEVAVQHVHMQAYRRSFV
ncbi:hypothetical protein FJTKL_11192 [Diaporthe vaccinii]|uniref:Protein kinase domain-containing protein n=1 Tax=Diaporthe vaccinii TaxID=105482 RepID=A0ABR4EI79_9PEZI